MNLFQRLLYRRLCAEASPEGGDGGGAAPAGTEPAAASDPAPTPASDPAPEGKPADPVKEPEVDKAGEKDKAKEPEKKDEKPVVPEKYEFKAPEGVEQLDPQALAVFEPIAKELGLSQEQAQKLVDIYPQIQQQQAEVWSKQVIDWGEQVKADKEIGGDKLTASVGQAQKALDQFGTPALRDYLHTSGLGNHPELVRAFAKVGKMMSEDKIIMPNQGGQRSAADILYGKKE
ncbi:peptidase [Serratia fonticola]|uniref:peptidase n=1 Tax=Serratia fonticola TaxID=47917 RepID=UPI003AB05F09